MWAEMKVCERVVPWVAWKAWSLVALKVGMTELKKVALTVAWKVVTKAVPLAAHSDN